MSSMVKEVGPELKIKLPSGEEMDFFEKIRQTLGNKHVYAEFLRCLNLYSQVCSSSFFLSFFLNFSSPLINS